MDDIDKTFVSTPMGDNYPHLGDVIKAVNTLLAGVGDHRVRYKAKTVAGRNGYELSLEEIDIK